MRAEGQMISRGIHSLNNPNQNPANVRRTAKRDAKNTVLINADSKLGRAYEMKGSSGKFLRSGEVLIDDNMARAERAGALAHEYGHKHTQNKRTNHITANALGAYFDKMFPNLPGEVKWKQMGELNYFFEMVPAEFNPKESAPRRIDARQRLAERTVRNLEKSNIPLNQKEYAPIAEKLDGTVADTGYLLGEKAVQLEVMTRKPGIGLFVIRELAKGRKYSVVVQQAREGRFDRELIQWAQKNPRLMSMIRRAQPLKEI
jgi:hypothetical protein